MGKQRVTIELDDETVRLLEVIGEPAEMVAQLTAAAVSGVLVSRHSQREQTNESLRLERREADQGGPRMETVRDSTDKDLTGERVLTESALVDLREANQQMVTTTLRAEERAEEAAAAMQRAEEKARELAVVAEFRELFIGILGHDLRTPLSAIVLATSLLRREGHLDPRGETLLTRINRATDRMSRMITQLLDLTRVRLGGGIRLEPKPTDLREVCQRAVEEFETPIRLELQGDLTGTWDTDRLAEVLSNLTGNALEYAAPGTEVTLRARGEAAELVIEVTNLGKPIPADVLPFIFDPFRRATPLKKSAAGNLGLGLYIAKQIIVAHGGTLEGHSLEGKTTFAIHLPRKR